VGSVTWEGVHARTPSSFIGSKMKKKSIWPYKETYKGKSLEIFKDGSVVTDFRPFINLDTAFTYIDKKEKMNIVC